MSLMNDLVEEARAFCLENDNFHRRIRERGKGGDDGRKDVAAWPACEHCGRVVLAGVCCARAQGGGT